MKKVINIGSVAIGGGNRIAVQSMTNTKTTDIDATTLQIRQLIDVGCDIVRVGVPDMQSAKALSGLVGLGVPIVADIHFDYKLAIAAIENGAAKIRINPGNITEKNKISQIISCAKQHNVPIRVGVNSGSLDKSVVKQHKNVAEMLAATTLDVVRYIESLGFFDIVVAIKSSNVAATVDAVRVIDKQCDYPLHLGITEAGIYEDAVIKSAVGIGSLLLDGIGDTIRVSISGDPLREVEVAKSILQCCGKIQGVEIISCPTCARTQIDVEGIATKVKSFLTQKGIKSIKVAVMGCVVNGIGECGDCDVGIAGGVDRSAIFSDGKIIGTYQNSDLLDELLKVISAKNIT